MPQLQTGKKEGKTCHSWTIPSNGYTNISAQCDEVTPRCTRCSDRDLTCQYQRQYRKNQLSTGNHGQVLASPKAQYLEIPCFWSEDPSYGSVSPTSARTARLTTPSTSGQHPQSPTSPLEQYEISPFVTSPDSPDGSFVDIWSSSFSVEEELAANPELAASLDSTELDLLKHYIDHTSRVIPFDSDDLYALHIGFPSIAMQNKTVMHSILALAAVCKSNDELKCQQSEQDRLQVLSLLCTAEKHHKEALRQTHAELPDVQCYDYILANAPLMMLYSAANHAVRIRLSEMVSEDVEPLPVDFVPRQSQWLFFIRAAHLAYSGVLNERPDGQSDEFQDQVSATPDFMMDPDSTLAPTPDYLLNFQSPGFDWPTMNYILTPEDGPSKQTRQLLFPILAATSGPALTALRTRAESRSATNTPECSTPPGSQSAINPCLAALDILDDIASQLFHTPPFSMSHTSKPPSSSPSASPLPALSRLSSVSPWLRNYLARVTMATPTRPFRRTVTAFVNRVPAEYLRLIQPILDQIDDCHAEDIPLELSSSGQLVLDIFAHWLVLAMLLDGVWWMGDIGAWELGRIVGSVGGRGWFGMSSSEENGTSGHSWWPASMYRIGRELKKQDVDG